MKKTLYMFALAAITLPVATVSAQDSTKTTDSGKLTLSGYLDSYYLTAFNRPQSGQLLGAFAGRAFDRLTDQFALGLVQTKFAYTTAKSEMVIDLTFGPNAELGNFGNHLGLTASGYTPGNANQNTLYGTSAAIKQAYFTYKITDKWSFTVGQFGTHIGYEVIDAPVNYHYSLSNLFNNGPFYHIGAKTNYMFSDKFGVMLGILNNWDALTDWKSQKSTAAQVFVSPLEGWNIYVNYIGGYNDDGWRVPNTPGVNGIKVPSTNSVNINDAATPGIGGYIRNMFDITTGYQITDRFYVGINAAYGWYAFQLSDKENYEFGKPDANAPAGSKSKIAYGNKGIGGLFLPDSSKFQGWGGIAIYTNFKINDMLGVGLRYEHFDDRNWVRYHGGVNNAITITAPITLADGHLIIKPEFRWDTGVMGYSLANYTANIGNNTGTPIVAVDPNSGDKMSTGNGYYETPDVAAAKDAGSTKNAFSTSTSGQSTIGLAFIYKY
jgi:hypothetical protein